MHHSVPSPETGAEYPNSLFIFDIETKTWNRLNSKVTAKKNIPAPGLVEGVGGWNGVILKDPSNLKQSVIL